MPLIIADTDGTLLHKSLSLTQNDAKKLLACALAADKRSGVFTAGSHNMIAKEFLVCGKKRVFYTDIDKGDFLSNIFGETEKSEIPLSAFTRAFADAYAAPLRKMGITLSIHHMAIRGSIAAHVQPLLMCVSLMVQILAVSGAMITLSALRTEEGVTLFADSSRGTATDAPFLIELLSELSVREGFAVGMCERADRCEISLRLTPVDIALYGFKSADAAWTKKMCKICADIMFGEENEENC